MKHVDIYTDGSCLSNPGPGGWCAILTYNGFEKVISGGSPNSTNNRMELMATVQALSALKESCDITLISDSKYVIDSLSMGWAASWKNNKWKKADKSVAQNTDLWDILLGLIEKHNIEYVWVKGHAGHPYNERCDKIAQEESHKYDVGVKDEKQTKK